LLAGLTNKYNIWASTLDKADVDVMHDRIDIGANLLKDHVFQFDFLNDDFSKLPEGLRDIINDEEKRKKLIIYINPPYAEAMNRRDAKNAKTGVNRSLIEKKYQESVGKSIREIFVQFFIRVANEIPDCKLAAFSKLKHVTAPNFLRFRQHFKAKCERGFICRANTFDNVKGLFPIGFLFWDLSNKKTITRIRTNVMENDRSVTKCWKEGVKVFHAANKKESINDWLKHFIDESPIENPISICCIGNDFQHNNFVNIRHESGLAGVGNAKGIAKFAITPKYLIAACIYFSVRQCIPADWLNDRDQFLYPNDGWKTDREFRSDCLAYTLFHSSNNVQSQDGVNRCIPFTESEVNARSKFKSNFMTDFIAGKIERTNGDLFSNGKKQKKIVFSPEAKAVFVAGRKLWTYYHSQKKANVNASLYDIREHFQGRNDKGRMNTKSDDAIYTELIGNLRTALKILATKIKPKVYEYGFLKE
jgi:hypothetical protein